MGREAGGGAGAVGAAELARRARDAGEGPGRDGDLPDGGDGVGEIEVAGAVAGEADWAGPHSDVSLPGPFVSVVTAPVAMAIFRMLLSPT